MKGLGAVPIILGCIILGGPGWSQPVVPPAHSIQPSPQALPAGVQKDWWSQVQANIQREEYEITWQEETAVPDLKGAYQAPNRAQGFRTVFTEEGIRVVPRDPEKAKWEWGLALAAQATGSRRQATVGAQHAVPVFAKDNRIEFDRGWITEWYVNSPEGLEQGFTIPGPLPAAGSWQMADGEDGDSELRTPNSELHLDLRLTGDLHPKFAENGQAVDFCDNGNFNVIHYAKLIVTDANGQVLPSRFEGWAGGTSYELPATSYGGRVDSEGWAGGPSYQLPATRFREGGGIRIVVDAAGAAYPITIDPLATSTAWTAESDQAGANFGSRVATAGDVNGDGFSDVIVGADSYDTGIGDAGRVFVYHGSAAGLSATANWTAESDQANCFFGQSVATAGDVNGDGYSDVIIGAVYYDNGQINEGRAFAWYGSSTGLGEYGTPGNADWTAESNQADAYFGCSVATAGDVNGDGFSDVIVGAYQYGNGQAGEGRAFLYHGSASGLSAAANWTAECDQNWAYFGNTVGTAGDLNGDGYSDVLVGATYYNGGQSQEGRAFAYHGSASGLSASPAWTAEVNQVGARFGATLATAGDVNGDGYSDAIVAAYAYDNPQTDEGKVFVFHGSASGLSATANWTSEGDQTSANFGVSMGTAGDVNGDGYADVIIGAQGYDGGQNNEGRAFVYLGSASGLGTVADWTAESNQADAYFGNSAATAGDVNGDGFSDVIVGASQFDNGEDGEGGAFVYHGSPSGLSAAAGWAAEADQAGASMGWSVGAAGDVNGDGYSDVIVGAYYYDNGQANEGAAFVFHGSATGLGATATWAAEGGQAEAHFGWAVGTAGDVNGDGYSEVVIGARDSDNGQAEEGQAYVFAGSPAGLGAAPAWMAEGDQVDASFGVSVGTAGDVNGDGYADLIVGACGYSNGQDAEGRAYVYLGSAAGLGGTAAWTAESDQTWACLGVSVGTAGDVNGDGYSDIIVGAHFYDHGQTNEGAAFVFLGSPSGLAGVAAWTAEGDQDEAMLGWEVDTAGDVDGDGYSDVIVGAPSYDNGQTDEGIALVYAGGATGPSLSPMWMAESDQANAYMGWSVGTAGDVNGDGFSDILVGAFGYSNGQTAEGRAYSYLGSASGLSAAANWTAESDQASGYMGWSLGTAGDVNGDGYADILVGAPLFDQGESAEGRAFLFYGNGGPGLALTPQQRRADDAAPIAPLGRSDGGHMFEAALKGRTPYGTGKFKVEWEVKPLGTLFDGIGAGRTADWHGTGVTGLLRKEIISGLASNTVYHWRARLLYQSATTPFQQAGRWLTMPWNGWQEADLRTAYGDADLAVSQTDSPDPLLVGGGDITYTVAISNAGPDQAEVTLTDTIPAGAAFVSATPSQGSCGESGGVVTCGIGPMLGGGNATVILVVTPPSVGSYINHAAVSSPAGDDNPANNAADETTTVNAPAIGNFVWSDTNGDGIQDAGEPGTAGIVVQLYDSTYTWLAQKVTNTAGFYQFTGLTYGNAYFVKVFPPAGDYAFSQPDQGAGDTLDSDVSTTTGQTPIFTLVNGQDPARWDAGLIYGISCTPPDETVWLYAVSKSVPDSYPILNFQDPNQPNQRTGWNIRRSSDPGLPKETWPIIGSNVTDMDAGTPNYQYTDITGAVGTWYYQVTAYNAFCPAEGPF